MEPFNVISGTATTMLSPNIDTDVIMPKQFLKRIDRKGLDRGLFYDLRFLPDGEENPDFILNAPGKRASKFLIVGPNFGCGSSREHAVWGLVQFGIRAVIGTSFAGIFYENCLRNGVLTIRLSEKDIRKIAPVGTPESRLPLQVDLPAEQITLPDGTVVPFVIDRIHKSTLLEGRDAIDQTLRFKDLIYTFENKYKAAKPWLFTELKEPL